MKQERRRCRRKRKEEKKKKKIFRKANKAKKYLMGQNINDSLKHIHPT